MLNFFFLLILPAILLYPATALIECEFYFMSWEVIPDQHSFSVKKSELTTASRPISFHLANADTVELIPREGALLPINRYFDIVPLRDTQGSTQYFFQLRENLQDFDYPELQGTLQCMTAEGESNRRDIVISLEDSQPPKPSGTNGCQFYLDHGPVMQQGSDYRISKEESIGSQQLQFTVLGADEVNLLNSEEYPARMLSYFGLIVENNGDGSRTIRLQVRRNLQEIINQYKTDRIYGSFSCMTADGESVTRDFNVYLWDAYTIQTPPTTKTPTTTSTTKPTTTSITTTKPTTTSTTSPSTKPPPPTTTPTIPTTTISTVSKDRPKFTEDRYSYEISEKFKVNKPFFDKIGVSGLGELELRIVNGNPGEIFQVSALPTVSQNNFHNNFYRALISLKKPLEYSKKNRYELTLEAWDEENNQKSTAVVVVQVLEAKVPVFNAKSYFTVITEHHMDLESPVELPVVFPNEINIKNKNNNKVNYIIVDNSPSAKNFVIGKETGILYLVKEGLEHIGQKPIELRVRAFFPSEPTLYSEVSVKVTLPQAN